MSKLIGMLFISMLPHGVWASDSVLTSEIPSHSDRGSVSLLNHGAGAACLVIDTMTHSLPCNPAGLYREPSEGDEKKWFSARLFVGGEYARFKTINQLLNGPYTQDLVDSLFKENQVIDTQASGDLTFRSTYFGASFTPYHLTYFSVVRNQAYPVVAFRAMQERTFKVQVGGPVTPYLIPGLQLRFVERQLVQNEFTMFEAIVEGEKVFERQDQNVLYIEPGLNILGAGSWKPKASLLLSNMGVTNRNLEATKLSPVWDLGGGISPPIGLGELQLGAAYRISDMRPNIWDRLSFAADYQLGLIEMLVGWSNHYVNLGLMSSFWSARVGVLFASRRFENADQHYSYDNSVMTEFGFEF